MRLKTKSYSLTIKELAIMEAYVKGDINAAEAGREMGLHRQQFCNLITALLPAFYRSEYITIGEVPNESKM